MTFQDALKLMKKGEKVKRPCWTTAILFIGKESNEPFAEYIYCGNAGSSRSYKVKSIECSNILSDDWILAD